MVGPTPVPVTAPPAVRGGAGDEGIGAVVDVEQRALRAFEHDLLAVARCASLSRTAVSVTKGAICSASAGVLLVHLLGVERLGAEERVRDGVLLVAGVVDVRAQQRGVEQVDDAQAVAVDLVFVGGADAAAGGADLGAAGRGLGGELDHAVVGQDDLGAVGDEELRGGVVRGQAGVLELFDLVEEGRGIEHDAVADDAFAAGAQDAAGDQLQNELLAVDDDGVAGVVAAGVAGDDVEASRRERRRSCLCLRRPTGRRG